MSTHPARILASIFLFGGGLVVGVTALAIVLARVLVEAGAPVRAADAALLGDLVPVLPFVVAFAVINLVAAVGLAIDQAWGDTLAVGTSIVAVVTGAIGLILVGVGRDPFASTVSARSTTDGLGIVGAFTLVYIAAIVAVAVARQPRSVASGAVA